MFLIIWDYLWFVFIFSLSLIYTINIFHNFNINLPFLNFSVQANAVANPDCKRVSPRQPASSRFSSKMWVSILFPLILEGPTSTLRLFSLSCLCELVQRSQDAINVTWTLTLTSLVRKLSVLRPSDIRFLKLTWNIIHSFNINLNVYWIGVCMFPIILIFK